MRRPVARARATQGGAVWPVLLGAFALTMLAAWGLFGYALNAGSNAPEPAAREAAAAGAAARSGVLVVSSGGATAPDPADPQPQVAAPAELEPGDWIATVTSESALAARRLTGAQPRQAAPNPRAAPTRPPTKSVEPPPPPRVDAAVAAARAGQPPVQSQDTARPAPNQSAPRPAEQRSIADDAPTAARAPATAGSAASTSGGAPSRASSSQPAEKPSATGSSPAAPARPAAASQSAASAGAPARTDAASGARELAEARAAAQRARATPTATQRARRTPVPRRTPNAVPTPRATATPAASVTPRAPLGPAPFVPPVLRNGDNKWGVGIYRDSNRVLEVMKETQPGVIMLMDPEEGWARKVREAAPNAFIVGRRYKQEDQQPLDNPERRGAEMADWVAERAVPLRGVVDAWMSYNEVLGSNPNQDYPNYNKFLVAFANRLQNHYGIAAVASNDGSGAIEPEDYPHYFAEAIRASQYLGVHAYSPPATSSMKIEPEWHALRYRKIHDELERAGIRGVKMVITESGLGDGFRPGVASDDQMAADFAWFTRELQKDPYMIGHAAFGLFDATGAWSRFELTDTNVPRLVRQLLR